MSLPKISKLLIAATAAIITGLTFSLHTSAADALSESEVKKIMHDRHERFEDIGGAFKVIRDQVRAKSPDMAKIDAAAETIAQLATELKTWFPEGTGPETGIKTETKAEVWTDAAGFEKAADDFIAASKTFKGLTATGDAKQVMGGIRGLGGACKNCHDNYREEEE